MTTLVMALFLSEFAFSQSAPQVDAISIAPGGSVTLEVHRPTRVTCTESRSRCEIGRPDILGVSAGQVALFINSSQVTGIMGHRELLVEYELFRRAGLCP